MGKLLPSSRLLKTMKIQVMCDQTREYQSSKLTNGDGEPIPVVSMAKAFEDIENLKDRLNDHQDHIVGDSDSSEKDQPTQSKEDKGDPKDHSPQTQQSKHLTNFKYQQDGLTFSSSKVLDQRRSSSNGLDHNLRDMTLEQFDNYSVAQSNATDLATSTGGVSSATQDISVDVSNSARFSKVLENISLPLLYIPTTKQLIAQEQAKKDTTLQCSDTLETNVQKIDERYTDNIQSDLYLDEIHSPLSGIPPSSSATTNTLHNLSPTADYSDTRSLNVYNQEIYPDYLRPCDVTSSSHLFADDASLSSVSTGTDFSVSAFSVNEDYNNVENKSLSQTQLNEESIFMDINLHSRNSFDRTQNTSTLENGENGNSSLPTESGNKKGLSSFRILFGKKVKEDSNPGWKLFGKVPPKVTATRNAQEISSEFQARHKPADKPLFQAHPSRKQASEVMSTTALILEKRPDNLPTKSPEEEEKHRQEYYQMVEAAKKKEQKDSKLRKKRLQQQRKYEDKLMSFARMWTTEILPNWEAMRQTKKVRDIWWLGLPPNVRGKVWMLAIGNDLNITHELYEICHKRAEDKIRLMVEAENNVSTAQESTVSSSKEDSVNVIKLDVSRTFPQLGIIQKGGPYHDLLHSLLGAYACYRPDVGYVQGMSFIAAILLLNMEVADAFVCFANVLNRPCQVAFFRMDENIMAAYYKTFEAFFKENLPKLHSHFNSHNVTPNLYLMEWIFLLYGKSLPLDVACRVWDVYCRDGEEFLFRTAIAILKLYEIVLLKMDFIHIAQFLTKLPEDIRGEDLFHELEGIRMSIDKRAFNAVHAFYKDLHETSS